jgi:hypothetical protein
MIVMALASSSASLSGVSISAISGSTDMVMTTIGKKREGK